MTTSLEALGQILRLLDTDGSIINQPPHGICYSRDLSEAVAGVVAVKAPHKILVDLVFMLTVEGDQHFMVLEDGDVDLSMELADLILEAEGVWLRETSRIEQRAVWLGEVRPSVGKAILDEP